MPKNPWELDWTGVKTDPGASARVKPTSEDMKELREASAKASVERDARREYASTAGAVRDMNTGPWKARWLDMITPDQDGGILDTVGSILGAPARVFVSDKTLAARDHMNTVSARTALQGSQMMKGSSSDKDTALMRTAGVSPYKSVSENNRIIEAARRDSYVSEARALFKSKWISKMGSMSNARSDGMTYEQALAETERRALKLYEDSRKPPKAPPPRARGRQGGRTVIDLNGNPIR